MGANVQIKGVEGSHCGGGCSIGNLSEQLNCEIIERNVQVDHVHLLVMVPLKVSVSGFVKTIKGRIAIVVQKKFRKPKEKPFWGNHLWARGYRIIPSFLKLQYEAF
ncbi:MAG: IS200/IS605 family transposase [Syntrophobacteraceae bacterium]